MHRSGPDTLFSQRNAQNSLFSPVYQANRTDVVRRGDRALKAALFGREDANEFGAAFGNDRSFALFRRGYSGPCRAKTSCGGVWRAGDEETENYTYAIALQNDT